MIAQWWRNRRRRRILARGFPDGWDDVLAANVRQYDLLPSADRQRLRECTAIVVAEKYWEGCGGLQLTDEIRITIAAQASLLLLGGSDRYFDRLKSILVYTDTYRVPQREQLPGGAVRETFGVRLGEAWHQGPVILSWANIHRGDNPGEPGRNVVVHEFAHVLDLQDNDFNGTPALDSAEQYDTWQAVMTAEFHRLQHDVRKGQWNVIDAYGSENPAEFFAVATESFFEEPAALRDEHPRLYNLLRDYYRQDPAEW